MEEIRGLADDTVQNPEVAEKLKAYYNQFANARLLMIFRYVQPAQRGTGRCQRHSGVEAITENGIVANGKEYAVDCIVYASGFEITSSYERRLGIPIFGIGGKSIYEHWRGYGTMMD